MVDRSATEAEAGPGSGPKGEELTMVYDFGSDFSLLYSFYLYLHLAPAVDWI